MRADIYIAGHEQVRSRTMARKLIEIGAVTVDGMKIKKASEEISDGKHAVVILPSDEQKYVSRGGLKLEAALDAFSVPVRDKIALDVGASTGGFTDCLLQRGACHVFCVDSGEGQLHPHIRCDSRVTAIDKTNARTITPDTLVAAFRGAIFNGCGNFDGRVDLAVMDVSFISQTYIHLALSNMIINGGMLVSLIKPQFEVGKGAVGKGGIVKNECERQRAVDRVLVSAQDCGFKLIGVMPSPIEGGDGNREFVGCFIKE